VIEDKSVTTPLEIDFHFDGDTQYVDGYPIIVFGEKYSGEVLLRNREVWQYVITDITAEDSDMKILQLQENKYVMPGETRMLSFEIATTKGRRKPFKLGVNVRGGFIV
jgi:hypothetical protein